jgi:hypothetical protein
VASHETPPRFDEEYTPDCTCPAPAFFLDPEKVCHGMAPGAGNPLQKRGLRGRPSFVKNLSGRIIPLDGLGWAVRLVSSGLSTLEDLAEHAILPLGLFIGYRIRCPRQTKGLRFRPRCRQPD